MISQNDCNVGIYCRLSRDDSNGNHESMSIANQRDFLVDYVKKEGLQLRGTYIDDGISGTTFDRPDFKRMLADAEHGKINCIVTKDLSRLGRNYVQSGYYTEEYFVERGIRFIAVNDNVDTGQNTNDIMAFHHVVNEFYPKQVSQKVRQVKRQEAEQGKFMGSQSPYGYIKSPEDKHKLIVDEAAAVTVLRVFREFYSGVSGREIAHRLTQEGVDSPQFFSYNYRNGQKPRTNSTNHWSSSTICQMLDNPVYVGDMAQQKRQNFSHKSKRRMTVDRADWIVVRDTHEPIIDRELWEEVRERRTTTKKRVRKTKGNGSGDFALLSGCLFCADCGARLAYQSSPKSGAYRCSRYNNAGASVCSTHYILEETLADLVLRDLRQYAKLAVEDRQRLEKELLHTLVREQNIELRQLEEQERSIERRQTEINRTVKSLYEDKCKGTLTETLFQSLASDYTREQSDLSKQLEAVCELLTAQQDAQDKTGQFLERVQGCFEIETLTREVVMALVDRITVGEAHSKNGQRTQPIQIQYKFIGNVPINAKEDIA